MSTGCSQSLGNAWLLPKHALEDAKVFARFTYIRTVPLKLVVYMLCESKSFFSHSPLVLEIVVGIGTTRVLDSPPPHIINLFKHANKMLGLWDGCDMSS